jgi:hypothetical protein
MAVYVGYDLFTAGVGALIRAREYKVYMYLCSASVSRFWL